MLGTLGASLLGNLSTGKETVRAGEGTIRAGEGIKKISNSMEVFTPSFNKF